MAYLDLMAEMARNQYTKRKLCEELNKRGYKIGYDRLCRQLRGETDIPLKEVQLIAQVLHSDVKTLFGVM